MELPSFVLKDENGEPLDSSLLGGMRLIVCFMPDLGDDSVAELCDFDAHYHGLMIRNIVTIMVVRAGCAELRAVMDAHGTRIKMLSDTEGSLSAACGLSGRSTLMVSKEGEVVASWNDVRYPGHADAVYEKAKLLFK